jgi:uncharacterized protein
MNIWVDADACPKVIKEILFKAAVRTHTNVILVSNHAITTPPSPYISKIQVLTGFDVADDKIMQKINPSDLVITGDIPLAAAVIEKHAIALNPRGQLYTRSNIKERLSVRNISAELRDSGIKTRGPAQISKREIAKFANELERILLAGKR